MLTVDPSANPRSRKLVAVVPISGASALLFRDPHGLQIPTWTALEAWSRESETGTTTAIRLLKDRADRVVGVDTLVNAGQITLNYSDVSTDGTHLTLFVTNEHFQPHAKPGVQWGWFSPSTLPRGDIDSVDLVWLREVIEGNFVSGSITTRTDGSLETFQLTIRPRLRT